MKKKRKSPYIAFVLLCALCVICFWGCGLKDGQAVQNVKSYSAEFMELAEITKLIPRQDSFCMVGNDIYFQASADEKAGIYRQVMEEGAQPERLPLSLQDDERIDSFCVGKTGEIYCVVVRGEDYMLRYYGSEGDLISEADITERLRGDGGIFLIKKILADENGRLYVCSGEQVYGFDEKEQFAGMVEVKDIRDICLGKDGEIYVTYGEAFRLRLAKADWYSGKPRQDGAITGNGALYTGVEGRVLYYDAQYLYEYYPDSGEKRAVCRWLDCDIDSAAICAVSALAEGSIRVITGNSYVDIQEGKPITLAILSDKETKAGQAQEKEELLIVATDEMDALLQGFVVDYNKQSDKYHLTYELVYDYNKGRDDNLALINARLVSQNSPDLMIVNYNLFQSYMNAEALEDLTPYLQKDMSVRREDYIDSVIGAFERDNGLYGIPRQFILNALVGRTSQVGGKPGWSIEEFIRYLEENPDVEFEWDGDAYGILQLCLKYGLDNYVDFDLKTCHFDEAPFKDLLLRIKALNRDNSSNADVWRELLEDGGKVMAEIGIVTFSSFQYEEMTYGDSLTIIGYPSSDGSMKCRLFPSDAISIVKNSRHKEGAWDVLKQYLLQSKRNYDFPARKAEFEEEEKQVLEKQYQREEDGSFSLDENGEKIEQPVTYYNGQPFYAMTEEEVQKVREAIAAAIPDNADAEAIKEIVMAEALEYFYDRKTLDEVIDIIQNRAQLYLSEL